MKNNPKILVLDIETRPAKAYVWRMWDENISPDMLIEPGGMICFGARWLNKRKVHMYSEWEHGHEEMVKKAHEFIEEADAIVTYNGDRFDLPKLNGEFLLYGLNPPAPPTSIDVLKTVKKMGFVMNRLAYIGPLLKVGEKIKNEGFPLWKAVMDGDPKAQKRVEKYCKQDVNLLAELYEVIKPYILNHPNLGGGNSCGACGSNNVHSRGYRLTKHYRTQRLQCQDCGSWSLGKREKIK